MAEEKKPHKKRRGHRLVSGPQFTHVFGGGYYLGPSWLGYQTAQNPSPPHPASQCPDPVSCPDHYPDQEGTTPLEVGGGAVGGGGAP